MAWIEYHDSLLDHWKIRRFAKNLNIDYPTALGHISLLWLWAVKNAPNGILKRFENEEIQRAMQLEKTHIDVKKTLLACELIDKRNKIHDWHKHGLKYLVSTRKRVKEYRKRLRYGNVTVTPTNQPNQPNLTVPTLLKDAKHPSATTFKNLVETKALKMRQTQDDPRRVNLRDIEIRCNGQVLNEGAKHKMYNRLIDLFSNRGWNPDLIKSVMVTVAGRIKDKNLEGQIYPYYDKALAKYINENAEMLNVSKR